MIKSILVVCEGNICRSPMAMGLLARQLTGARVVSAGTRALVGEGADPIAIDMMAQRGVDLTSHRAAAVDFEKVRSADLVLAASSAQRQALERVFPFARGRVFRICEHGNRDVTDPYRRGRETFDKAFSEIESGIGRWVGIINQANQR